MSSGKIVFCFILFFIFCDCYEYEKGPIEKSSTNPCPGLYCGRSEINETHYGSCGKCLRGWRVKNNTHSICQKCEEPPEAYDWFYLLFMALFVLILHWVSIDTSAKRWKYSKEVIIIHFSALCEVVGSALLTVLLMEPTGKLDLVSCRFQRLSDWYSVLHNPNPNYEETLHCTQEVIYPLYSMIFIFYAFCILLMLVLRPYLFAKFLPKGGRSAIYASLYFLPILAVIHAIFGGLIYYTFPYIIVILSIISSAAHFALRRDQSPKALIMGSITDERNAIILIGHWIIHAFGILAITQTKDPTLRFGLMGLVPLPAIFYIATAQFSEPIHFSIDIN